MRADRLLSILLLLQVHRRLTARDLAARLEVSERTIHRDMEALSIAGVPVYAQRGAGGGWILPEEYRTDPAGLTETEVRALFVATPERLLADLGLERASAAGLMKLLAAIPSGQQIDATRIQQRIHLDVTGWRRHEESTNLLPLVQEAVWTDRALQITYRRGDDHVFERVIDPLGLVASGSVWYLVAGTEEGTRIYRISRIEAATILGQPVSRPNGFDLAAAWDASKATFMEQLPRYVARLRVAPGALDRMRRTWRYARFDDVGIPDDGGWIEVTVRFQFEQDAREHVLALADRVRVLDPPALREAIIAAAARVVDLYHPIMLPVTDH
jgi:predicted DNA-binding transcriptional regulator YafY